MDTPKMYLSNNKKILTDLDESILICQKPLEYFCNAKLGKKAKSSVINIRAAYDIDEETATALIYDFWFSDAMKTLAPEPCAAEVLPRLYAQGWRFVGVTACANEPEIAKARIENLKNAFGFYFEDVVLSGIHHTGPDGKNKKGEILEKFAPAIWVEDNFINAVAGAEVGHKTFLFHRDHNADMHHDLISRVQNWYEIENYITENGL